MFFKKWLCAGFACVSLLFFGCGESSEGLDENLPWYIALGASVSNGVGVNKGLGHVPQFHNYLETMYFKLPVEFVDLSVGGATSEDILQEQVNNGIIFEEKNLTNQHVISVAAGGNDMLQFMNSPAFFEDCINPSKPDPTDCFSAISSILVAYEDNLDDIFSTIRAFSPNAVLLVRNQFNPLMREDCQYHAAADLASAALAGAGGPPIPEGLNGILKRKAEEYDGHIVEIFMPFAIDPNTLVGTDCVHPTQAGYDVIYGLFIETIESL
jgi:lysophospholipase L1-like esterase